MAESFWFLIHFEFTLKAPSRRPTSQPRPLGTFEDVSRIWRLLWHHIRCWRDEMSHDVTLPRLRSLDVVIDTESRFLVDLAERDDEASKGIPVVRCAELEALRSKLSSSGPLWNREQSRILSAVTDRAKNGTPIPLPTTADSEMMRPPAFWDMRDGNRFYHR